MCAVGELNIDEIVIVVERDGDKTAFTVRVVFGELCFLHDTAFGRHEEVAIVAELFDRDNSGDLFVFFKLEKVDDSRTASRSACGRDVVAFDAVHTTAIREEEDVMMRRCDKHMFDEIFFFRTHARDTATTAFLTAVGADRHTLDVVAVRERKDDVFYGDEFFIRDIRRIVRDGRTTVVAEFAFHFKKLFFDDAQHLSFVGEDGFEPSDLFHKCLELFFDLVAFEACEALETHIEDSLCLFFGEAECFHQALTCFVGRFGRTDKCDDGFDMVERDTKTFQDMRACFGFRQFETCTTCDNVFLMFDIVMKYLV